MQFKEVGRCVIGKSTGRPSKSATQLAAIKIKKKYRKNTKKRVSKVTKQTYQEQRSEDVSNN